MTDDPSNHLSPEQWRRASQSISSARTSSQPKFRGSVEMSAIRQAFEAKDGDESKHAHKLMIGKGTAGAREAHSLVSEHLKSVVYGGLDGIVTTFAVVSGAAGGGFDVRVVLALGFSTMFADALSMGVGDALSTMASNEAVLKERKRELWEFDNYPEGEIAEMVDIYKRRGMSDTDAHTTITTLAKYPDIFIDQMVQDELGMQVPDPEENPWFDGLVTFGSFVFFGLFPLLGYVAGAGSERTDQELFGISIGLTGAMLFVLGVLKSKFTSQSWLYSGCEILLFGGLTAAVSFFIGWLIEKVILSDSS